MQQGLLTEGRRGADSHDACADGDWRRVHCYLPAMLSTHSTSVRHFRLLVRLVDCCVPSELCTSALSSTSSNLTKTHEASCISIVRYFFTFIQGKLEYRIHYIRCVYFKCSVNCIKQRNIYLCYELNCFVGNIYVMKNKSTTKGYFQTF